MLNLELNFCFPLVKQKASNRSRVNSISSVTSETVNSVFSGYATPQRKHYPPSDIDSEIEACSSNESASMSPNANSNVEQLNRLLNIYKNKFTQLKSAYVESENEKEKLKVWN